MAHRKGVSFRVTGYRSSRDEDGDAPDYNECLGTLDLRPGKRSAPPDEADAKAILEVTSLLAERHKFPDSASQVPIKRTRFDQGGQMNSVAYGRNGFGALRYAQATFVPMDVQSIDDLDVVEQAIHFLKYCRAVYDEVPDSDAAPESDSDAIEITAIRRIQPSQRETDRLKQQSRRRSAKSSISSAKATMIAGGRPIAASAGQNGNLLTQTHLKRLSYHSTNLILTPRRTQSNPVLPNRPAALTPVHAREQLQLRPHTRDHSALWLSNGINTQPSSNDSKIQEHRRASTLGTGSHVPILPSPRNSAAFTGPLAERSVNMPSPPVGTTAGTSRVTIQNMPGEPPRMGVFLAGKGAGEGLQGRGRGTEGPDGDVDAQWRSVEKVTTEKMLRTDSAR